MKQLRVLNTRPREQASELSALLRGAGFSVVEAPAIATESAWDPAELARVRASLASGDFDCVVLPSANAGRSLVGDLAGVRVVCGTATARALGLEAGETLERFSASAALGYLRPHVRPGQRVLAPRAAEGRDELILGLGSLGLQVTAPVAYRTLAVQDAANRLAEGGIDLVVLCSPSAVASVAAALPSGILVACLGQTTADAARAAGLRIDAVATETSMPSLVGAIESLVGVRT
jgi:uroporphyrinogen-III synthase